MRPPTAASLSRKRRLALATLWFERLWPAIWPALGVVGAYACFGLLDLPAMLPPWARIALLLATIVVAALLLAHGLRRLPKPDAEAADRRLEQASGLRHRPLATLADQPAVGTPEQDALWREHIARVGRQIANLRVGTPRPGLAKRDGWALRGALLVALVASLGVAGPDALPRLERAIVPSWPATPPGPGTVVQAWVTPPAYTGLPPIILRADSAEPRVPVGVPVGAHVTLSVTGERDAPQLTIGGATSPFQKLDEMSWQAEGELGKNLPANTGMAVTHNGQTLAAWSLTLIPDQPPVASFTEPPGPQVVDGRPTQQSRVAWQAIDDYGVASVEIALRLRDRTDAPPLVVPGVVGRTPKSARGVIVTDLTAHPWAGLAVLARVIAKDAPGQIGESPEVEFILPERSFRNPIARVLIAVRRQLSLTPQERRAARTVLDGVADQPETFDNATGVLLNLRALSALLTRGREPNAVDEAQSRMWDLAISLEENETERTAQALDQARQELRDLLDASRDQSADPNHEQKLDQAEVDRKIQELRDAIQKHLDALAEQARRNDAETPFDPSLPQMNAQELDKHADRLEQALKDGRKEDAKREMAELEKLLEQLKNAKPETAEARAQRREQQRQRGREQMGAVQDMVQREGKLLDRSETRAVPPQRPRPSQAPSQPPGQSPGQSQTQNQTPGQQPAPTPQTNHDRTADAKSQQAMRRALGELMQRYGDLTGEVPAPLGEADQAMRDGAKALAEGRDAEAGDAERHAIEALQRGNQEMGQQIARQFGIGQQQGQGEEGEGDGNQAGDPNGGTNNRDGVTSGQKPGDNGPSGRRNTARRDPLGRPLNDGTSGSSDAGLVHLPDEMEQARTREIQDELRRRGADRSRPRPELDYIDRLLKPF